MRDAPAGTSIARMGFVPSFENDIFISYRHAANEEQDRWVDEFEKALKLRLASLVGKVEFWKDDEKIRAGDEWNERIQKAIDSAAIFLAVVTRTYRDSKVCSQELDRFLERYKDPKERLRRIVPIFKHPLRNEKEDVPSELTAIHHHKFYETEPPPSQYFLEFRPVQSDPSWPKFCQTFERLSQDLMLQLEELKGEAEKGAAGTVFLARVGPELHEVREQLRSDLRQRRYRVIPDREFLWSSEDLRAEVASAVSEADLSIHLVSRGPSAEPTAVERTRLQLDIAAETMKARSGPSPMVWIQPAPVTDPGAEPFIRHIQDELANEGLEFWERGLEDFKTQIYDKLKPKAAASVAPSAKEVAILVEDADLAATQGLATFLVEKLQIEPVRIRFSGAAPRDPAALGAALERAGRVVLFWGGASEEWVGQVLRAGPVAACAGRDRICVYAAAPSTPEKGTFLTGKARLVREVSGVNENELTSFLGVGGASP